MHKGDIVESGDTDTIILTPAHPYTQLLLNSSPKKNLTKDQLAKERSERLASKTPVTMGQSRYKNKGCNFIERCPYAKEVCATAPGDFAVGSDSTHKAKCWLYEPNQRQ